MTYTPSLPEKKAAAIIQVLAGLFLVFAPFVALRTRYGKISPYVQYWGKACLVWSLIMTLLIAVSLTAELMLDFEGATFVLWILHFVFCMTGSICSFFNTPFFYWFVAHKYCREELGHVYGQLISTPVAPEDESS